MLKSSFLLSLSFVSLGLVGVACSSSDASPSAGMGEAGDGAAGANSVAGSNAAGSSSGGADAAGADSGGADTGGADSAGADTGGTNNGGASAAGASAGSSAGGAGPLPPGTSSCQYSVTGGATESSPNSASVCGQSKIATAYAGGFTASVGGGFQDAAGNIMALACTIDSPKAPAAGDSWVLSKAAQSQGNCELNIVGKAGATIWAASANDATLSGAVTIKFNSATLTHGIYKPADVYYFFDATLDATIPGQSAGAAEVKVSGRFQVQTLPIGS